MPEDPLITSQIQSLQPSTAKTEAALGKQMMIAQEVTAESFQSWVDEGAFNPVLMARRFETMESKTRRKGKEEEAEKASKKEAGVLEVEKLQKTAEQYQQKNPELQGKTLLLLRARLSEEDTAEEILQKVLEAYSDHSIADDALAFLTETTEGKLAENVKMAREVLNERFGREVRAGKNINLFAREFSEKGLGSPTALRDLYRDITGNPRDATALFEELTQKFTYDKMRAVIDFVLHSLGSDLKAKGPSISHAELYRMLTELRSMQAILGVYRFFKSRMALITAAFARSGLPLPPRISFELLSKVFVRYLAERYPSAEKLLLMAIAFGLEDELEAQIILYTQMRDGIRQVAPRLFRSPQHRQDVLTTYLEALEELEEKLEEDDDEEDEKE